MLADRVRPVILAADYDGELIERFTGAGVRVVSA
jgi:hypothetical protein